MIIFRNLKLKNCYDLFSNSVGINPYDFFYNTLPDNYDNLCMVSEEIKKLNTQCEGLFHQEDCPMISIQTFKAYQNRNDKSEDNFLNFYLDLYGEARINLNTPICIYTSRNPGGDIALEEFIEYIHDDKYGGFYKVYKGGKVEKIKSIKELIQSDLNGLRINFLDGVEYARKEYGRDNSIGKIWEKNYYTRAKGIINKLKL